MDRRKIALWCHQEIEELADPTLGKAARRELLRKTARLPVRWPSGDERTVSEPTLRRWLRAASGPVGHERPMKSVPSQ